MGASIFPDPRLRRRPPAAAADVAGGLLLAQVEQPLLYRLEPQQRVRVLAALALVVLLGFGLVLFAWWGARVTRRYLRRSDANRRAQLRPGVRDDDWASKPLVPDNDGPQPPDE